MGAGVIQYIQYTCIYILYIYIYIYIYIQYCIYIYIYSIYIYSSRVVSKLKQALHLSSATLLRLSCYIAMSDNMYGYSNSACVLCESWLIFAEHGVWVTLTDMTPYICRVHLCHKCLDFFTQNESTKSSLKTVLHMMMAQQNYEVLQILTGPFWHVEGRALEDALAQDADWLRNIYKCTVVGGKTHIWSHMFHAIYGVLHICNLPLQSGLV